MDLAVESALRVAIMDWVRERAEVNGGFLHRHELLSFSLDGREQPRRRVAAAARSREDIGPSARLPTALDECPNS